LTVLPAGACAYNSSRIAQLRALAAGRMDPSIYHGFMDAGFRRSGRMIYQPVCAKCRRCVPIRIPVEQFELSKSQRRVVRRNADLRVSVSSPSLTDEKYLLYKRYLDSRHDGEQDASREGLEQFLYESPVETAEFEYRTPNGHLMAVGICDLSQQSLSSVYFYFDPDQPRRSLGHFGVLQEIEFCRVHAIPHVYLGYWVVDAASMSYKIAYKPCELLWSDGIWRGVTH